MSQADTLLENLTEEQIQAYTADPETEPHIVVGADRFIIVPDELKRLAVQHDHNIETVTFDCPRYWDDCDMSEMAIYINYMRPNRTAGFSVAKNITVEDDIMHFDWTITREVTEYNGELAFLVCIKKVVENAGGETEEVNHWNSELNTDCYISEGLEVDHSEEIMTYDPDIVTSLLTRMSTVEGTARNVNEQWNAVKSEWNKTLTEIDEFYQDTNDRVDEFCEDVDSRFEEFARDEGFVPMHYREATDSNDVDVDLRMNGSVTMPNAAKAPSVVEVTDEYYTRPTANGLKVVDNTVTKIESIRGRTAKSINLLPALMWGSAEQTVNGVVIKRGTYGSYNFNGLATGGVHHILSRWKGGRTYSGNYVMHITNALPKGSYFWLQKEDGSYTTLITSGNVTAKVTLDGVYTDFGMWVSIDGEFENVTCWPMLVREGVEVDRYVAPTASLSDAVLSGIISTGRNLVNVPKSFTFTRAYQIYNVLLPAGTYYFSCSSWTTGGTSAPVMVVKDAITSKDMKGFSADKGLQSITLPAGKYTIQFYANGWNYPASEGITSTINGLMFCRGSAREYEPYTESVWNLPDDGILGEWDTVDVENGVITRGTGRYEFTGEENFTPWYANDEIVGVYLDGVIDYDDSLGNDIRGVCNYYDVIVNSATNIDMVGLRQLGDGVQRVYLKDSRFTSVEEWKEYLGGLTPEQPLLLFYKKKTPTTVTLFRDDISVGYTVVDGGIEYRTGLLDTAGEPGPIANPVITQTYFESANPEESATKSYVDVGLSGKLDKFMADDLEKRVNATIKTLDTSLKEYANQSETDAVATAKTYTDGQISTLDADLKEYANQSETDAVATAKTKLRECFTWGTVAIHKSKWSDDGEYYISVPNATIADIAFVKEYQDEYTSDLKVYPEAGQIRVCISNVSDIRNNEDSTWVYISYVVFHTTYNL